MTAMPHLPSMRWDYRDDLEQVDLGGGGTAYYVYDASGQRVRKVVEKTNGTLIEERIYLGGFEVYRKRQNGTVAVERETLHTMDDQQRIALVETRTQGTDDSLPQLIRYQFSNHLGSASLELDHQAQIISYEEYYAYGSTSYQAGHSGVEVSLKRYRYMGKERDAETGLSYHSARYYAPWLGRWVSPDPIMDSGDGDNVYADVRNNPIIRIDPYGTDSEKAPNKVVEQVVTHVHNYYKKAIEISTNSLSGVNITSRQEIGKLAGKIVQEDLESILGKGTLRYDTRIPPFQESTSR
jgi:RHS repeat-associated protein